MGDTLEFNEIYQEVKGSWNDGRLRFSKQNVVYKSNKTGKVDSIPAGELNLAQWRRVCLGHGIKLSTSTGHVYKYDGFRDTPDTFHCYGQPCVYGKEHNTSSGASDKQSPPLDVSPEKHYHLAKIYDIRIYPTFLHLHGKTFDYKIPYTTVLRLFLLPHKDQRQMFFVISLDPPIKQGQTRYHFLILLFSKEEDINLTLNMNEDDVERRFEGKLNKNMSGSLYEVVSRVMKALVNRKITVPGNFQGHSGAQCITCSYKASSGLLYPLERGFIYVHKPPVHLRFEEISCVNFARGTTTTRSFDFEIETKQGNQYTFSSIEREEYGKLFDFVNAKKLNIKNRGFKEGMKGKIDDYSDSDEDKHDAYLERMKAEGKIREEGNDSDESDAESDESFNPGEEDDDIAEEYDSNASASDSSDEGDDSEDESSKKKKPKKVVKEKKERKERKPRKEKKQKDAGGPKRPMSAYMLWLNSSRERIKAENPGISITEISKKAGEMWRGLGKDEKEEWETKAGEAKRQYDKAKKEYKESGGGATSSSKK
uniref:FACT complex subunit SSRP1 n=1 Tax=Oryzias sinensis TaxID=183150 RepID=A0A8C7YKG2_9TELE